MKELLSLRHWAVMVIVLPSLLVGLCLGGYLTYQRFNELDQNLTERGIYLSEPLSLLCAHSIRLNQQESLATALDMAHRRASPIVRSISVFLPDHQLYISSNYHNDFDKIKLQPGRLIPNNTQVEYGENHIYVRTPIYGQPASEESFLFVTKNGRTLYGYLVVELSRDKALLEQQSSLFFLISLLVISVLFTLLFAFRFIERIVDPIRTLIDALADIIAGKTKTKVKEPMLGEIDTLRMSVNNIGKEIYYANERAEHNISEYTQELQQTVEQLEVQNIQLSMARRDAQNANDVKSQFLANMSHELRTPLNGVLGFTRQLKKTSLNVNQRDFLETIETSAVNLLRIINDILDFSKLDASKMELEDIPFALRDTVNDVMTLLAPNVFDKGLNIYLNIDEKVPDELRGDPDRLKQIIINLLGNAIKFTLSGYVRLDIRYLSVNETGHQLRFTVTDTGVGIDKVGKEKLFAAFGQADSSVTRKFGGTGLGLIICKKLIEAMDGDIHFKSETDKGSQFFFDVYIKDNHLNVAEPLPIKVLTDKHLLYMDSDEQSLNDGLSLLKHFTELKITHCSTEKEFVGLISDKKFDLVLISHHVSPSTVGEMKHLISIARQYCEHVFTVINSISPNLKEAFIGSGATACLSLPINHRKLIGSMAAPYLETTEPDENQGMSFRGMKVLAVDDHDPNLKLLKALLSEMSVQVDTERDGQAAWNLAQKHKYDAIFLDIQMPIMDGITACQKIRESSLNETTPIISVTAHAAPEEQAKILASGFDAFLSKPIDEEMLKQILFEHCPFNESGGTKNGDQIQSANDTSQGLLPFEVGEAPEFAKYPQVDWSLAMQRSAGKYDLAIEMFTMLMRTVPETLTDVKTHIETNDVEQLLPVIHKFHGACCYTGVPNIKLLAETIESGLKRSADIATVEPELYELIDELEKLLAQAECWSIAV